MELLFLILAPLMAATTAINLNGEHLSALDVCKELSGKVHKNSVYRWMTIGVSGVYLKSFRAGGQRFTTRAWLNDFIRELNDQSPSPNPSAPAGPHRASKATLNAAGA